MSASRIRRPNYFARRRPNLGDLNMNDPAVIDALNSGMSPAQVAQMQASGLTDAQLEGQALSTGIVSNVNPFGTSTIISGIPDVAIYAVGAAAIFLVARKTR